MAEQSWPFDDGSGGYVTEDQWRAFARNFAKTGLVGSRWTSDNTVAAAAKVTAGTGAQIVRAAAPDGAYVDGMFWKDTASRSLSVTTNSNASARIDRVVLRLDPTDNEITTEIITGTPGSNTPPSLTRSPTGTFDCPLFRYTMPGSASTQAPTNFVDERRWTVPVYGGKVGYGPGLAVDPGATQGEQSAGMQLVPAFTGEILEVRYTTNFLIDGTRFQGISWGVNGTGITAVQSVPVDHFYNQYPNGSGAVYRDTLEFSWKYYVTADFPTVGIAVNNRGLTGDTRIVVKSTNYELEIK